MMFQNTINWNNLSIILLIFSFVIFIVIKIMLYFVNNYTLRQVSNRFKISFSIIYILYINVLLYITKKLLTFVNNEFKAFDLLVQACYSEIMDYLFEGVILSDNFNLFYYILIQFSFYVSKLLAYCTFWCYNTLIEIPFHGFAEDVVHFRMKTVTFDILVSTKILEQTLPPIEFFLIVLILITVLLLIFIVYPWLAIKYSLRNKFRII